MTIETIIKFGNPYTLTAICENVLNGLTMGDRGRKYIDSEYDLVNETFLLPLKSKTFGCMYVIVNFDSKVAILCGYENNGKPIRKIVNFFDLKFIH
jgi:hypothetical protein